MLDVQTSIGDYYRSTATFDASVDLLATRVRSCLSFVQVVNGLLEARPEFPDYTAMFKPPEDPRTTVILGFEYVRNVAQHIAHPVRPDPAAAVGGIGLGYRTYATWQDIPSAAHDQLWPRTQKLKSHYDHNLRGQEVTGTLLDVTRIFAEICPDLVHRRPNGEWTGFPLSHQAGVHSRLHPEEPDDPHTALAWMASRRPGGDCRVICGSLTDSVQTPVVFGLTFVADCAFVPFFETAEQIAADIAVGFDYFEADVAANTLESGTSPNRSVLCGKSAVCDWAGEPLVAAPKRKEHTTFATIDFWLQMWEQESAEMPTAFLTRRERRLNASAPDPLAT